MLSINYKEYKELVEELEEIKHLLPDLQASKKDFISSMINLVNLVEKNNNKITDDKGYIISDKMREALLLLKEKKNIFFNNILINKKFISFSIFNSFSSPMENLASLKHLVNKYKEQENKEDNTDLLDILNKNVDLKHLDVYLFNQSTENYKGIIKIEKEYNTNKSLSSQYIQQQAIRNSMLVDFIENTNNDMHLCVETLYNPNIDIEEKRKTIDVYNNKYNIFFKNVELIKEANFNIYSVSEDIFDLVKMKLNKLDEKYNFKPSLNTGVFIEVDHDKELDSEKLNKHSYKSFLNYISVLSKQCVLAEFSDKNTKEFLKNLPAICGDYFFYIAEAQLISFGEKDIEKNSGLFLSKKIKDDFTILTHEIEHFKDMFFLNKTREFLGDDADKKLRDFNNVTYLSELHMKETLLKMLSEKSILDKLEENALSKSLEFSVKKQNIYLFNKKEVSKEELLFKDCKYNHLKEQIVHFLTIDIYKKITGNLKYIVSKNDNEEIVQKLNSGENKVILQKIKTILEKSIIPDVYIQSIIDAKNKNKNVYLNIEHSVSDFKSIGILGDNQSKKIMLKTTMILVMNIIKELKLINKIKKSSKDNRENESELMNYIAGNMFSLKNIIKGRLIMNKYDNLVIPKNYISFEEGNEILSSVIDNSVLSKNVARMTSLEMGEKKDYILSPMEIYARNTQVFGLKTFMNKSFINSSNAIVADKIKEKMEKVFSSSVMKNITSKQLFEYKKDATYNFLLDEISEEMHKDWKELNEKISELMIANDFSFNLKSKSRKSKKSK